MMHPEIPRLAEILRTHLPFFGTWPQGRLEAWIEWFWLDARCGVVRVKGEITAVVLARLLREESEHASSYEHHEEGSIVWVDAVVCHSPALWPCLLQLSKQRFGDRLFVGGALRKRSGRVTKIPFKTFERIHK